MAWDLHHGGLAQLIVDMDERGSLGAIRRRLAAGDDPLLLMDECRVGMERVGELYESGTYFISALIMAGEIFREAAEILVPLLPAVPHSPDSGTVVIATVQGDIHDIGKNIAITLLDAHGFTVIDLGVDVTPARIAEAVTSERPDVLGLSCLLTTGFGSMRQTVAAVRESTVGWEHRVAIVVGGAAIDQHTADLVGADGWCTNAADGIKTLRALLG